MQKQPFPLHPSQRDVFLDQLINEGSPFYNIGGYVKIEGNLDIDKFKEAASSIPKVFDAFRMRFELGEYGPICFFEDEYNHFPLPEIDFSGQSYPADGAKNWMQQQFNLPFTIKKDSLLFEHYLVKIANSEYWYFRKYHHLVTDGYGFSIETQYIAKKYQAILTGIAAQFVYPSYQPELLKAWDYYNSKSYQIEGEYWKERIKAKPKKVFYRGNNNDPGEGKSGEYIAGITEKDKGVIDSIRRKMGCSLQNQTIAALIIYLHKVYGCSDVVFGTSLHKRRAKQARAVVGMFSGVMPFKWDYKGGITIRDLIRGIENSRKRDYRFQNYLMGDLKTYFNCNSSEDHLFEIVINDALLDLDLDFGEGIRASAFDMSTEYERYPLRFWWREYGKGQNLQLRVDFQHKYFCESEVKLLVDRILFILEQFNEDIDKGIESIRVLPELECDLMENFNNTATARAAGTVVGLFEEVALRLPDAIALVCGYYKLTYGQLNSCANKVAGELRARGVKAETLVPICLHRSMEMLIGILGIWKAGGAYVPIDPEYPAARIRFILEDTGAEIVLTTKDSRNALGSDFSGSVISIEDGLRDERHDLQKMCPSTILPGQLAYVIYTSGTTGNPNGVLIEHFALMQHVSWFIDQYGISDRDSTVLFSSFCFDGCITTILPVLLKGGCLHVISDPVFDPGNVLKYIYTRSISYVKTLPSILGSFINCDNFEFGECKSLRLITVGGEKIRERDVEVFIDKHPDILFANHYGPTECTVAACFSLIDKYTIDEFVLHPVIGVPVNNTRIYICDELGALCPIGVPGELFIGGVQVGRGYLNRPSLTSEKFLPDPFDRRFESRMYKTGDLTRWLPEGKIEYLGRMDNQVKVRGFRIELEEIENCVNSNDEVSSCCVVVKSTGVDDGGDRLFCYYVPEDRLLAGRDADCEALSGRIRESLLERLPEYMVPRDLVALESLPLTGNSKVDRKFLASEIKNEKKALSNKLQENSQADAQLLNIWQSVLGVDEIGEEDDFFKLGGHSLLAIKLISAVRKQFNVSLGIGDIFDSPTFGAFSAKLSSSVGAVEDLAPVRCYPRPADIPLSFSQERLWLIDRLEGSIAYHVPVILRLRGDLDEEAIVYSVEGIMRRHEALRTVIREVEGRGYQEILPQEGWHLRRVDGLIEGWDEAGLAAHLEEWISRPFDLTKDYMMRGELIRLSGDEHLLGLVMHHIASDGWSASILVGELSELYGSYVEGRAAKLRSLPVQYADYAIWQRQSKVEEKLVKHLGYWREWLQGTQTLELPTDHARAASDSKKGGAVSVKIDGWLGGRVRELSQEQGVTLFMTLLAVFKVLLYRYSGQKDISIGSPVAGRQQQEVEGLVGFFVNMLVLRSQLDGDLRFIDYLAEVKRATLEAFRYQEVPFGKVVEAIVRERDMSRTPIFQVVFGLRNTPEIPQLRLGEVEISKEEVDHRTSQFDLSFSLAEDEEGISGSVEYCTDLFDRDTVERMIGHYKELLKSVVLNWEQRIGELGMLGDAERRQLLEGFNATGVGYPKDRTVMELFEEQAGRTPDGIAVVFGEERVSYGELEERSNRLGHYLRGRGVRGGMPVLLCVERSVEMIVGMLGILKAGGAYVPVDPEYPKERIGYIWEDIGSVWVVSDGRSRGCLPAGAEVIDLEGDGEAIGREAAGRVGGERSAEGLAYVIYTSGSTGRPKGVMIEQRSLTNLVYWHQEVYGVSARSRATCLAGVGFDACGWEIWPYLTAGASVYIVEDEQRLSPGSLPAFYEGNGITHSFIPTALLGEFVKGFRGKRTGLEYVLVGGDKLCSVDLDGLSFRVINNYGPTENTVVSSSYELAGLEKEVYTWIGKPIANERIYILDAGRRLVPVGVWGELWVGGAGLARGYWGQADLTAERFVADPFRPGERMYRTGDTGRWLSDGNIEYRGRVDDQVKVRGYRIEPGEIEGLLAGSGLVREVVVVAREDGEGGKRLVGYVVVEGAWDREGVISYLKERLPEYMVPLQWVTLERLPLTVNGKVDKRALPEPEGAGEAGGGYVAPGSETERALAGIWAELLGLERVGVEDNFFELGGDSITTIQVVSRAGRLGYNNIRPRDLFVHQTIAELCKALAGRSGPADQSDQGHLTGRSGLLPIQRWYFSKKPVAISHFNQSVLLRIDKGLTEGVLRGAMARLTDHHDSLRFRYHREEDGSWSQEYGDSEVSMETVDLEGIGAEELGEEIRRCAERYQGELDIERGRVMRIIWMRTPGWDGSNRLLIVLHHLVTDAVSWRIMLEDLGLLLSGEGAVVGLGRKGSSYRQWHEVLLKYGESGRLLGQKGYWNKIVSRYSVFPADKEYAEPVRARERRYYRTRLGGVRTRQLLQEVSWVYQTEINDLLLSALGKTLTEWSGKGEVIIGLEGHGREDIGEGVDISRTVGWFATIYPVILGAGGAKGYDEWVKGVKEGLRKVPDKGIGYGVMRYMTGAGGTWEKDPWDIIFNYLGQMDHVAGGGTGVRIAEERFGKDQDDEQAIEEKLSVSGAIIEGELWVNWGYSDHQYEERTIIHLAAVYQLNLEGIIVHCLEQGLSGKVRTPSDFGLTEEIGYEELDRFMAGDDERGERADVVDSLYRLTGFQEALFFHALGSDQFSAYMEQFSCEISTPNVEFVRRSWEYLIRHHSILRSGFYYDKFRIPVQCVYREVDLKIDEVDYRGMSGDDQRAAISGYEREDRHKGFDFRLAPLMRVGLIRLSDVHYHMFWTSHHILFDGWSVFILLEEFLRVYKTLSEGKEVKEQREDRYEDYIRYLERRDRGAEEAHWRQYLAEQRSGSLLPFVLLTSERNKGVGIYREIVLELDRSETERIERYAQVNRITVNTIMQGVWAYLLHRYTGEARIVYGITVSGRPDDLEGVEERVGLYINTIPLRTLFREEDGILEWLKGIQTDQLSSRQYQYASLNDIQGWLGIQGDLFDSLVAFQNYPINKNIPAEMLLLELEKIKAQEQTTNFPLSIRIALKDEIKIQFIYKEDLLDLKYAEQIRIHFEHVLHQMTGLAGGRLKDIEMLGEGERHQLLEGFNATGVGYPKDRTVMELFEEQAGRTPDGIAVVFGEERVSYGELEERSNRLGHYLRGRGVRSGMPVLLCVERSVEMIVGMLGILKAGGAYVPVDPEYPKERIGYIWEDIGSVWVVSDGRSRGCLPAGAEVIDLEGDGEAIGREAAGRVGGERSAEGLAYVIYTSGSTGRPKGVMIEQRSLTNLVYWHQEVYGVSARSRATCLAGVGFDACGWEIWPYLTAGASVYIVEDEQRLSPGSLPAFYEGNGITHSFIPTALLGEFVKGFRGKRTGLEYVLVGGDKLCSVDLDGLSFRVINNYGPTENTVVSSSYELAGLEKEVYTWIGKPIANERIYILDAGRRLVPVGVWGELWVGGAGLARGYWGQADLTAERFVADPFRPGERMYRTGDTGRWLSDGNIEYRGRVDDQVKVRGYRIEPGEIEGLLAGSGLVREVVVVAREDGEGGKRLVGYVVVEGAWDREGVISYLKERLPEYMVPLQWVTLERLPLTVNGKVDKRALPEPEGAGEAGGGYVAPGSETERALAGIWAELLGLERVGVEDSFFELGGHSLLVIRLVSQMRNELKMEVEIGEVFEHATIRSLLEYIGGGPVRGMQPVIAVQERPDRIPLSFGQERLWFIDRLEGSVQYHIPWAVRLRGTVSVEGLERSLRGIVDRHEVLRTVIREQEGEVWQEVWEKGRWRLEVIEGEAYASDAAGLRELVGGLVSRPFDLSADSMLRAQLIRLSDQEQVLVVVIHHIASDGWSVPILARELSELYGSEQEGRAAKLPELGVQYADYALWQRRYLSGAVLEEKLGYWKEKLSGVGVLELPADRVRPAVQSVRGAAIGGRIDGELTEGLRKLCQREGATLYMGLLSVFKILLYRYSGQGDICVGSPIAGRQQQEVEGLVGFFVNTVALRSDLSGAPTFGELLGRVKETALGAYEHQEVPFEKVVEAVVKERDLSRSPLFQVLFALQTVVETEGLRLGDAVLSGEGLGRVMVKLDLQFSIREQGGGLSVGIEYCTDLFDRETVERMLGHYTELLRSAVGDASRRIGELGMIGEEERRQVLEEFNATGVGYPLDRTVMELFEEQAGRTPEAEAVVFGEERVSYGELEERSNRLGHYLRGRGVRGGMPVLLCVERSVEMIVGILGILKAGGAYVPVDPEYPKERVGYMWEDIGAGWVVSDGRSRGCLPAGAEVIDLEGDGEAIGREAAGRVGGEWSAEGLAYVIYTSGSTGRPKGVMIEQRGVVNLCLSQAAALDMGPGIGMLQFASPGFDASCYEIFITLSSGGCLVLPEREDLASAGRLRKLIEKCKIQIVVLPPSYQSAVKEGLLSVKTIVSAGERLRIDTAEYFQAEGIRVINAYGPTENTVCTTLSDDPIREGNAVVIGKPIANERIYILDAGRRLVPVGVWGELWVGGAGLARGYWGQADLTAERFVADPFRPGERMYRTGDTGRWLSDGNIEYRGRVDDQVKVRGYRIEPGEIEGLLAGSGLVREVVVVAREDGEGGKRLVGYVVVEGAWDREGVISYLKERLPEYMVPLQWVTLERLPLTVNGKVDKRALPEPEGAGEAGGGYVAPGSETERALAGIWAELLGLERVGVEDNFFELGGDSITTIQVVSRARRLGYTILVGDLFVHQTIAELCKALAGRSGPADQSDQGHLTGRSGLLPIQRWYFSKKPVAISHFNQSVLLRIDKGLTEGVLRGAMARLTDHHDSLRFRYHREEDGSWSQEYGDSEVSMETVDLEGIGAEELGEEIRRCAERYQGELDIERGRVMRIIWMRTPGWDGSNRLLIVLHHLVTDAVSWRIMLEDLGLLLSGEGAVVGLGRKGSSYRQWHEVLLKYGESGRLLGQKGYWNKIVSRYSVFPADKEYAEPVRARERRYYRTRLGGVRTRQLLQEVSWVYQTEINDLLLSALGKTLTEWSGKGEVIIGLEGHGREDIGEGVDISRTVGWFATIYPVILGAGGAKGYDEWVKGVKEGLRKVPDKGIGYGVMRYMTGAGGTWEKDPWDIIFNYLGQMDHVAGGGTGVRIAEERFGKDQDDEQAIEEKLSVSGAIIEGELWVNWGYSDHQYEERTIIHLAAVYQLNLEGIIVHCLEQGLSGKVRTPSDFGLTEEIGYEELDRFMAGDDEESIIIF